MGEVTTLVGLVVAGIRLARCCCCRTAAAATLLLVLCCCVLLHLALQLLPLLFCLDPGRSVSHPDP